MQGLVGSLLRVQLPFLLSLKRGDVRTFLAASVRLHIFLTTCQPCLVRLTHPFPGSEIRRVYAGVPAPLVFKVAALIATRLYILTPVPFLDEDSGRPGCTLRLSYTAAPVSVCQISFVCRAEFAYCLLNVPELASPESKSPCHLDV